jgi:hypothetical protein
MSALPEYVQMVLDRWEWLALTAYEWYEQYGRLVIGIEEDPDADGPRLLAVTYDYEKGDPDETTAGLLATYDPAHEIIIQFRDVQGGIRTQRLRTAPDAQHPKRLYFFEMLRRVQEEPETLNLADLPHWLVQALEWLETIARGQEAHDKMEAPRVH